MRLPRGVPRIQSEHGAPPSPVTDLWLHACRQRLCQRATRAAHPQRCPPQPRAEAPRMLLLLLPLAHCCVVAWRSHMRLFVVECLHAWLLPLASTPGQLAAAVLIDRVTDGGEVGPLALMLRAERWQRESGCAAEKLEIGA